MSITIPAGHPLLEIIVDCYNAKLPVLLVGPHGVGKSQLMAQAAEKLGVSHIVRDLSLMEPPDLIGMPVIEDGRTIYAPPAFLPTGGDGLLCLEEINRADRVMRAPCLQLMTERALNDYRLPPGWLPVACVNPAEGGYDVDELDPALMSRFVVIHIRADVAEWLKWAGAHGVHADVIGYAQADKTIFDSPESSPRSWTYVSDLLKVANRQEAATVQLRAMVAGLVGEKRAAAFLAFRTRPDQPLTADEVLGEYSARRRAFRAWVRSRSLDLVNASMHEVMRHLQLRQNYDLVRGNSKCWRNLGWFLDDLPADLRRRFEAMLSDRGYESPPNKSRAKEAAV
jgi:hypothetical protein